MMFYSPFEIFSHIKPEHIKKYNNIVNIKENTKELKLIKEISETDFNISFLEEINAQFFEEIVKKLKERKSYLIQELNEYKKQKIPKENITKENITKEDLLKMLLENMIYNIR